MIEKRFLVLVLTILFVGCAATVPMEGKELELAAKAFPAPAEGLSGLYIYRSGVLGKALKKNIWLDGECVGESAPDTFFYLEVGGDELHKITTESEFSPSHLFFNASSGRNYFVEQEIMLGVFVGGARLALTDEVEGERRVSKLALAKSGTCSVEYEE
ncbi:DUF2846 domain-containing protein [Oceanicoccus sagamiensis]|uniref:DUF2846 domain-containing protein n=1 Tax=Oceanicoccus sagamiensis TaxID=716816 RepID=A0A1X9N9M7_9GAMM|nr:DUF2846 domain-containing protein [Oceanicoccus sagamiensis]ARN72655.1 hypothetical protein BST96_00110 [Oceanicoccus sagamiensis]